MVEDPLYQYLVATARIGGAPISIAQAGKIVGLASDRFSLWRRLDRIAAFEHERGRPLVTALVVKDDGDPGSGFFRYARWLKAHEVARFSDPMGYWRAELQDVYAYWGNLPHEDCPTTLASELLSSVRRANAIMKRLEGDPC